MTPERRERITNALNRRQPDLTVIMENIFDPHNIAAVMRTCDSVGIQEIYVLNNIIKRHSKFGKKSSASAAGWLTIHQYDDTDACMLAVMQKYTNIYATHLGKKAVSLYELNLAQPVALVFGNEHAGVTEQCLKYCNGNFVIPQVGMVKSLNISVACAVSLYETYRQREQKGFYNGILRLHDEQTNALMDKWGLVGEETEGNE